jgi:hypothetical protein
MSGEVGVPDQDVLEQELEELLRCALPASSRDIAPELELGDVPWSRFSTAFPNSFM